MINQGNDVPDKTIALFDFADGRASSLVKKPNKKRDWFTPHFYHCLPLAIANQYGFEIITAYSFNIFWNGGDFNPDTNISPIITEEDLDIFSVQTVASHFGQGIVTIHTKFIPRTPPGVNLLVTGPINTIIPNIHHLTGVIESDNIRNTFTVNLKVTQPNVLVHIPKGTPIATLVPIPRYFGDKFELKDGKEIFGEELFKEEEEIYWLQTGRRTIENNKSYIGEKSQRDKDYFTGRDYYGNKFLDHQKP
jgi:hypothetical protein